MVLATLLLMCSIPQMDDTAKVVDASKVNAERITLPAATSDNNSKDATLTASLPSAPVAKVRPEPDPISVRAAGQPFQPVKPVLTRPRETPRQRKMWYGLMITGHGAAAFDAWSTHRAVTGGYGQEANPFLRPFANSNAIYAATQVSPAVMNFIGKRMMVSQHSLIRKMWWLPQAAGAGFSFTAAAHNMSVVH
jgi:hypothetical protein